MAATLTASKMFALHTLVRSVKTGVDSAGAGGLGRTPAVAPVARARDRGDPGVLARASVADAERGRAADRHHARDRAAHPAHARGARPRALRRAAVLADAARAHARVVVPLLAQPLGDRAAVDGGPRAQDARVVLD